MKTLMFESAGDLKHFFNIKVYNNYQVSIVNCAMIIQYSFVLKKQNKAQKWFHTRPFLLV